MSTLDPIWPEPGRAKGAHSEDTGIINPNAWETTRIINPGAGDITDVPLEAPAAAPAAEAPAVQPEPAPEPTLAMAIQDAAEATLVTPIPELSQPEAPALAEATAVMPTLAAQAAEAPKEEAAPKMEDAPRASATLGLPTMSSLRNESLRARAAEPAEPLPSLRGLELRPLSEATAAFPAPAPDAKGRGLRTLGLWAACLVVAGGLVTWVMLRPRAAGAVGSPTASAPVAASRVGLPEDLQMQMAAADRGDVHAMRYLGACYTYGLGVPKDSAKGIEWYRKAAASGDSAAQRDLSNMGVAPQ